MLPVALAVRARHVSAVTRPVFAQVVCDPQAALIRPGQVARRSGRFIGSVSVLSEYSSCEDPA